MSETPRQTERKTKCMASILLFAFWCIICIFSFNTLFVDLQKWSMFEFRMHLNDRWGFKWYHSYCCIEILSVVKIIRTCLLLGNISSEQIEFYFQFEALMMVQFEMCQHIKIIKCKQFFQTSAEFQLFRDEEL